MPVSCHGIICICYRKDSCNKWYSLARKPVWITASIIMFMMMANGRNNIFKLSYWAQNPCPMQRMLFHYFHVIICKDICLFQNSLRYAYLSNIMKKGANFYILQNIAGII